MDAITIKIHEETRRKLRMIAAYRGRSMMAVIDGLVSSAYKELNLDLLEKEVKSEQATRKSGL